MNNANFDFLVSCARECALSCGDLSAFAKQCAEEVVRSGEPAFFLTTRKNISEPKRFPVALEMYAYTLESNTAKLIASLDILRPDYKSNSHGFGGNHLVVALLNVAAEAVKKECPENIEIVTSHSKWSTLIHGPGYQALKTKIGLQYLVSEPLASSPKKQRL